MEVLFCVYSCRLYLELESLAWSKTFKFNKYAGIEDISRGKYCFTARYADVALFHNISKTGVTFSQRTVLMRMITMNKTMMILREGKMGRVMMMMKVMIVAIYLQNRCIVAHSWTSLLFRDDHKHLSSQMPHTPRTHSHKHYQQFISWLAAAGRHLSRQLAVDTGKLLTLKPMAPPPAPLPVPCQTASLSCENNLATQPLFPSAFFSQENKQTYNPFYLLVSTFS